MKWFIHHYASPVEGVVEEGEYFSHEVGVELGKVVSHIFKNCEHYVQAEEV